MSASDVETVRAMYEAANRRDFDAYFQHLAPEIEFHLAGRFPDLQLVYRGHGGVREFIARFYEPWEELAVEVNELTGVGDQVLALFHFVAKGRDGIHVRLPLAHLWTFSNGKAVRMQAFADHIEARRAAGFGPGPAR